jgi:hypothetical protein
MVRDNLCLRETVLVVDVLRLQLCAQTLIGVEQNPAFHLPRMCLGVRTAS